MAELAPTAADPLDPARPGRTDRASTLGAPTQGAAPDPARVAEEPEQEAGHEGGVRVFPCEHCGADLELAIGLDSLRCEYCGSLKEIELGEQVLVEHPLEAALEKLREAARAAETDQAPLEESEALRCGSCGAEVLAQKNLASQLCAYCAAPLQKSDSHRTAAGLTVDGVVPFRIDRAQAHSALKLWLGSRWFAPGGFKSEVRLGRFQGVYLPYWTFDSMTFSRYSGRRGDSEVVRRGRGKNRRAEHRIRWSRRAGRFQRFFDDVLVVAASKVPIKLLRRLEPWPLESLKPFEQEFLAGFQTRIHDLELEDGFVSAKGKIESALRADVRRRIGGDFQEIQQLQTRYDAITFKHILLPLWLLTYRYGDRQFQIVVDALRGKVHGQRPISWVKVFFFSMFVLAVLMVVFTVVGGSMILF